jgi:hypothetical protein
MSRKTAAGCVFFGAKQAGMWNRLFVFDHTSVAPRPILPLSELFLIILVAGLFAMAIVSRRPVCQNHQPLTAVLLPVALSAASGVAQNGRHYSTSCCLQGNRQMAQKIKLTESTELGQVLGC